MRDRARLALESAQGDGTGGAHTIRASPISVRCMGHLLRGSHAKRPASGKGAQGKGNLKQQTAPTPACQMTTAARSDPTLCVRRRTRGKHSLTPSDHEHLKPLAMCYACCHERRLRFRNTGDPPNRPKIGRDRPKLAETRSNVDLTSLRIARIRPQICRHRQNRLICVLPRAIAGFSP